MKKWLVICTVWLLLLEVSGLACAEPSETESKKANLTGVYNVTFSNDQGQQQSARIMIEDLKNGKVEVSGDYKGYPVSIEGDLTGDVEKGGAICSFNINKPGLVTGRAEIIIQMVDETYQLQGQGTGSYSYLGSSGEISGQVVGNRNTSAVTSNHSPLRTAALIAGLAFLSAMLVYIALRRRAKKDRN